MKKLTLLIALLVAVITGANAQVELKGLVGLNFATFHGSDEDVSAQAGYQFGGGVLIGNKFYVEPGIQFVRHVRDISGINLVSNSVKIPVYAGYHLLGAEESPFALRIFGGPAVSIAGKLKEGPDHITKDDLNKTMWAVDGGLGLDIFFLFIEANYEYSFSDYFAESFGDSGKHGAFIVNAGIHIDF